MKLKFDISNDKSTDQEISNKKKNRQNMIILTSNNNAFEVPSKLLTTFPSQVKRGLYAICKNTRKSAITDTKDKSTKTGRVYLINKNGRKITHISSAPSQTHASITGSAGKSITFNVQSSRQALFGYDNSTKYAKLLELGTNKMSPRPTLQNAMKKEYQKNQSIMQNQMKPENLL